MVNDALEPTTNFSDGPKWRGPLVANAMWATAVGGIVAIMLTNPYNKDLVNMALGAMVILIGLLPLSQWLRQRDARQIPLLAMHLLFYVTCFGIAGFVTPQNFLGGIVADEDMYTMALIAAVVSITSTWFGFSLTADMKFSFVTKLVPVVVASKNVFAVILYPFALLAGFLTVSLGITELSEVVGAVRLFAFIWCMHAAWSGGLSDGLRRWLPLGLLPVELVLFGGLGTGQLVGLLVYGQILGVIYAITRNRVPVIAMVFIVIAFGVLQPIKGAIRAVTWDTSIKLSPIEGLVQFVEVGMNVYGSTTADMTFRDNFDEAYSRINHLHTTAAVISDTPSVSPFMYGETLLPLVTKWVPRIVWPDKPREDLGNRWAKNYNYLGDDDFVTSYNLPWIAEMYINFSWLGIAGLSVMIGALLGCIHAGVITTACGSAGFAFSLLISSAFFFPESNISLQIGRVITYVVAAWLGVIFTRIFNK